MVWACLSACEGPIREMTARDSAGPSVKTGEKLGAG